MPQKIQKLQPTDKPAKKKSGLPVFLLPLVLLLIVGGLLTWVYMTLRPARPTLTNTNTTVANVNNSDNSNISNSNISNTNLNTPTLNTNLNIPSLNTNQPIDNSNTNTPPVFNLDEDQDGLSSAEEALFQTDAKIVDSDQDGYKDGMEIANFYDPTQPNKSLKDGVLVRLYKHELLGYTLYVPSSWLAQIGANSELMILPDIDSGELFKISVQENKTNYSLMQYQEMYFPDSDFTNATVSREPALRSADRRTIIAIHRGQVYVWQYQPGLDMAANFGTTFEMMVKSFSYGDDLAD